MNRRLSVTTLIAAVLLAVTGRAAAASATSRPYAQDGSVDLSQGDAARRRPEGPGLQALLTAAGELKDVQYKVTWAQFTSGPPILEAINAGSIDFGGGRQHPADLRRRRRGSKISRSSRSRTKGVGGQAIVVPKDSPIKTSADLKGKKVAVAKGSSANYHLLPCSRRRG